MQTGGGRDIDQTPHLSCRQHGGQESPDYMHDAHEIDADHLTPSAQGRLEKRSNKANTCVVHHDVRRTRLRKHPGRAAVDGRRVADVAAESETTTTQRFHQLRCGFETARIEVERHDVGAMARKRKRRFMPDTRCRTSHQGPPSGEGV